MSFEPTKRSCTAISDEKNPELHDKSTSMQVNVNHGGIVIPYTDLDCTMKPSDFNLGDHCIGYRVKKIGFNIPQLHVTTRPNDKATPQQVVTDSPCFARMWFFVDVHNDYGIPTKDQSKYRHCKNFTDHHGISSADSRYLSTQDDRRFRISEKDFHCLLDNRVWIKELLTYKAVDPDHFYDMRQHPGYREQLCSEGHFNHEVVIPDHPFTLFPHAASNDLTWKHVWPSTNDANNYVWIDKTGTVKYTHDYELPADFEGNMKVTANWDAFYRHKYTPKTLRDRYGGQSQTVKDKLGVWPYMPDNDQSRTDQFYSVNCTRISTGVCDPITGETRLNYGDWFPLVMIGVHPDLEVKSTGTDFYNYHGHGQITYVSEVEFLYMTPIPSYVPIGLGGYWNDKADFEQVLKDGIVYNQLKSRKHRRRHNNRAVRGIPGNVHRQGDKRIGIL